MGEIVRTSCEGCDVDRQDVLGWGMSGMGTALCACSNCERLIVKRLPMYSDRAVLTELRCPYCKRPVVALRPRSDAVGGRAKERPQRCPRCGGELTFELTGLWD